MTQQPWGNFNQSWGQHANQQNSHTGRMTQGQPARNIWSNPEDSFPNFGNSWAPRNPQQSPWGANRFAGRQATNFYPNSIRPDPNQSNLNADWQTAYHNFFQPRPTRPVRKKGRGAGLSIGCSLVLFLTFIVGVVLYIGASLLDPTSPPTRSTTTRPAGSSTSTTQQPDRPSSPSSPGQQYVNDDYLVPAPTRNPGPLVMPGSIGEANAITQTNRFYQQPHPIPVRCELPPVNLHNISDTQLQDHLNKFSACLARVWGPAVENSGYKIVRPYITVYTGQINSPCGLLPENNAALCSEDQAIYFSADMASALPARQTKKTYFAESIIAHEYGHSLQAMTGILSSNYYLQYFEAKTEQQQDLHSRRLELQADCLAGAFVSSVSHSVGLSDNDVANLADLFYALGSPDYISDDHGQNKIRKQWFLQGVGSEKIAACNSWIVPGEDIP